MAEHAAPADGGMRHERTEGGAERRTASLRARRLVVRGIPRRQRLGVRTRSASRRIESDDALDAQDLYRVLSEEVIPLYYARDSDNVPRGWVELMKEAMRSVATRFSARRMVKEYVEQLYLPAMRASAELGEQAALEATHVRASERVESALTRPPRA